MIINNLWKLNKISKILTNSYKTLNYIPSNNSNVKIQASFYDDNFEVKFSKLNEIDKKQFPYIWLRDFCKCKDCFDGRNKQTLINLKNIPLDIKPNDILKSENDSKFTINWSDGHISSYDLIKLADFTFEEEIKAKKNSGRKIYWDAKLMQETFDKLKFNFIDYMKDDNIVLKKSLESLAKYGVMIVNEIPASIEASKKTIEKISFIQKTLYGDITFLTAKGDREDSAYSNVALKAHHDCTYLKNAPGLEIFQLLKHDGKGGATLLVDGFYCAQKLKEIYPDDFDFLTKINVKSIFLEEKKYFMSQIEPVIKLNPIDGTYKQIRYNSYDRTILNYLSYEETKRYYRAIKNFSEIIENNQNEFWYPLKEGELLFFDNFRIMHGRSEFNGERKLLTAYVPHDDWISKALILNIDF